MDILLFILFIAFIAYCLLNYEKSKLKQFLEKTEKFLLEGNLKKARKYAKKAIYMLDKLSSSPSIQEKYLLSKHNGYNEYSTIQKILCFIEQTLKENKKKHQALDFENLAILYCNIAGLYHKYEIFEKSVKFYEKAIEMELNLNNTEDMDILYNNLAFSYAAQKKYNEAQKYYQKSLDFIKKYQANNLEKLVSNYENLALVYKELDDFTNSIAFYKIAIEIYVNLNDTESLEFLYNDLALIYKLEEQYNEAEKCYKEVLKIAKKQEKLQVIFAIHCNLADLYKKSDRDQEAFLHYDEAIALGKDFPKDLSIVYNNLASLYERNNQLDKCEEMYLLSIENVNKVDDAELIYHTYNNLCFFYMRYDNEEAAQEVVKQLATIIEVKK